MAPAELTDTTNVSYCDWYSQKIGYVFSTFDNGIGAAILNQGDFGANLNRTIDEALHDWNATEVLQPLAGLE